MFEIYLDLGEILKKQGSPSILTHSYIFDLLKTQYYSRVEGYCIFINMDECFKSVLLPKPLDRIHAIVKYRKEH